MLSTTFINIDVGSGLTSKKDSKASDEIKLEMV